jgi:hypothetical protein
MSEQRKTVTEKCSDCNGDGYNVQDNRWDDCDDRSKTKGCTTCGGAGEKCEAKARGLSGLPDYNRGFKPGSGQCDVTYKWDGIKKHDNGSPAWQLVSKVPKKKGWFS